MNSANVLKRPVLVLNKSWIPVGVVPVQKAIIMVSKFENGGEPKAKILEVDNFQLFTWEDWGGIIKCKDDRVVRSVSASYKVPEIILLTKHNQMPRQRAHFSRRTLFKRDNWTCQYCGCKPGNNELSIDHITPKSLGGRTTWENCVAACTNCNSKKANHDLKQCGMKLLSKPKKPKYTPVRREFRCKSWEAILGEAYWEVELDNDMD